MPVQEEIESEVYPPIYAVLLGDELAKHPNNKRDWAIYIQVPDGIVSNITKRKAEGSCMHKRHCSFNTVVRLGPSDLRGQ